MKRRLRLTGAVAVVACMMLSALLSVAEAAPRVATLALQVNSIQVSDQPVQNGSITIASVTAGQDGWIAVFLDQGGQPGKLLGQTAVKKGTSSNVRVALSESVPDRGRIWPRLHIDAGTIGTFEFPGADAPARDASGNVVTRQITITATTPAPGATAAPAGQVPSQLPSTGGAAPSIWLGLALVALIGALVLRRLRQARLV